MFLLFHVISSKATRITLAKHFKHAGTPGPPWPPLPTRAVYLPAPHILCCRPSSRLFAKVAVASFLYPHSWPCDLEALRAKRQLFLHPLNLGWPLDQLGPARRCRGGGVPVLSLGLRSSCLPAYSLGNLHSPHVNNPTVASWRRVTMWCWQQTHGGAQPCPAEPGPGWQHCQLAHGVIFFVLRY